MKVKVRYWTEFGGSESTMNVEEIANFSERFKIMSVTPHEELCPICNKHKIVDGHCDICTRTLCTPKEPTIDDGWLSPMQRFRLREDKPSTTQEPKITLELTQQEARGLLNCLMRTSANGKDLDVGEMVEEKLWEFLKPLETK